MDVAIVKALAMALVRDAVPHVGIDVIMDAIQVASMGVVVVVVEALIGK